MLGIEAKKDIDKFFKRLEEVMELCKEQLLWRLEVVGKRHKYNYPFILGQNIFNGADKLDDNDTILPILKEQSLSIGFVGLAETLVALTGKHHGESEESNKLGFKILKFMRDKTDEYSEQLHLNFSLFATPAESTAGSMLRATRKLYGIVPGVTDRDYFTNSFHVPVWYKIPAVKKIQIEGPYHALCNAGAISYVECSGDMSKNIDAFEKIVKEFCENDCTYFSINITPNLCKNCHTTFFTDDVDTCPVCGYSPEKVPEQKYNVSLEDIIDVKR